MKSDRRRKALDSTRNTVTLLGHESADSIRLVRKLAVDAKAARHSGAAGSGGSSAALA
jgi:hypothetical protein